MRTTAPRDGQQTIACKRVARVVNGLNTSNQAYIKRLSVRPDPGRSNMVIATMMAGGRRYREPPLAVSLGLPVDANKATMRTIILVTLKFQKCL